MNLRPREPLAIVVALADPATPGLDAGLARFAEEAGPAGKVVLVDASGTADGADLASRYANVRVIERSRGTLAPVLWRDGLLAADAALVAFTTAQMVPTSGWIAALRARMRATGAAGVGGPIEAAPGLSSTDRAVALLRYANYFPAGDSCVNGGAGRPPTPALPRKGGGGQKRRGIRLRLSPSPLAGEGRGGGASVASQDHDSNPSPSRIDPPGDNALYRREALLAVAPSWRDGFWEVEVQRALRRIGETLAMADERAVVAFGGGIGLPPMVVQRFRHARRYGAGRAAGLGATARLARAARAPLVPPLLCGRIARALRARRMAWRPWIPGLPPLLVLATAWAIGEAFGTCAGGWPGRHDLDDDSMNHPIREAA